MCAIALFQPESSSKGFWGPELLNIKLVAMFHFEELTASQIGSVHSGYCTGILINTETVLCADTKKSEKHRPELSKY